MGTRQPGDADGWGWEDEEEDDDQLWEVDEEEETGGAGGATLPGGRAADINEERLTTVPTGTAREEGAALRTRMQSASSQFNIPSERGPSPREAQATASLPLASLRFASQKTDLMGLGDLLTEDMADPVRRDLMDLMRRVDALPDDGEVRHPTSNACKRRRSQYKVLQDAWRYLWPDDTRMSQTEMSTALNLVAKELGAGNEGEMVLDKMYSVTDAPHKGPVRAPRAAFLAALRYGILPAPPPAERPANAKPPKQRPSDPAKGKQAGTSPAPEQGPLSDEQVDQAYRDAGFDPRKSRVWRSTPKDALQWLERLKQEPDMCGTEAWLDDRYKDTLSKPYTPRKDDDLYKSKPKPASTRDDDTSLF